LPHPLLENVFYPRATAPVERSFSSQSAWSANGRRYFTLK